MNDMSKRIPELYGSMIFSDRIMRNKLPKDVYKALRKTIENGTHLELDVANSVAVAMKEWAVENGATHYTHWFQPMTGFTAEKHDSFISPSGKVKSSWISPEKNLSKENRMPQASLPAVFALPLKPEDTPHGTLLLRHLSKIRHSIFQPHFVLTAEKLWTRRHRFFGPWIL